ncbi:SufE family protein [Alkalimarinus sediminis]|uniref:SufE family protein n=1 Tax=Alkalimarinus sediminis TaxID=1632866 RepID=A0A9E8HFZ5_9ALTE|nr:SufE family protein [Alkalimarinus sediminis]UZW73734.1 SufE family protein [Alkalimarinus sediminis]
MTIDKRAQFTQNDFGGSINTDEILDTFEFLDDWEERYAYIIDLGKKLPAFPESEKVEDNYVHGCQSQVWLIHYLDEKSGKLYLLIESDALIVRGLAAVVLAAMNAKTPTELLTVDIEGLFEKMDLIRHVSPTRGNGLRSMVKKVQRIAEQMV